MNDQKGASGQPTDSISVHVKININVDGLPINTNTEGSTADIVPPSAASRISRLWESEHTSFTMNDPEGASDQPVDINKDSSDQPSEFCEMGLGYR